MEISKSKADVKKDYEQLLRMLDKGIDDMEAGRVLPLEDAFKRITELRNVQRNVQL